MHVNKEQIYSTFNYLIQIVSLRIKKKKRTDRHFRSVTYDKNYSEFTCK